MTQTHITELYPLLFEPVLKAYIWGGRNLETRLGRSLPAGQRIAESWEIAAHAHGDVVVANGVYSGQTLSQLTAGLGEALVGYKGRWALQRHKFPLLIKLLDANSKLSVQVHPGDDYAQANEADELGKTEMWVVLHAEVGASVILGVKAHTSPQTFREALAQGTVEQHLHEIPVKAGDFICVPSGSLHAILGGLLIAEVQQSSDVTYRVFDWNRVDDEGRSRTLHVDRALDVIDFTQREPALPEARLVSAPQEAAARWQLCRNAYFTVERVHLPAEVTYSGSCDGQSMEIWGVMSGSLDVRAGATTIELPAVSFTLLPAALGRFALTAMSGDATLLRILLE